MADSTTEIDLDSVIDRLLEGELAMILRRRVVGCTVVYGRVPAPGHLPCRQEVLGAMYDGQDKRHALISAGTSGRDGYAVGKAFSLEKSF